MISTIPFHPAQEAAVKIYKAKLRLIRNISQSKRNGIQNTVDKTIMMNATAKPMETETIQKTE